MDALVEGSDGVCIVEPIPLHSACNDELFVFRRAFLLCSELSYPFVARLLLSDSSSADSVSDVARMVLRMTTLRVTRHRAFSLIFLAV